MGYELDPPAAPGAPPVYRFLTKDGRKVPAFGTQAEVLARRLDESKAMAPQPTAGLDQASYGMMPPGMAAAVNAPPPTPPPVADVKPRMGTTVLDEPRNEQGQTVAQAGAPPMMIARDPEPPKPRYLPYMTNERGDQILLRDGGDPNNPADILVQERPRAGSRGGWRTTGQTVRGGHGINNELLAEQEYIHGSEQAATQLGIEAADATATAEDAYNQRLAEHHANIQGEAQAKSDAILSRVKDLDARYERLNKEYNSAGVDPRRMFAGGKNWMYGLAAGLSTFGAGLSKTPNFGVQVLQQRISDDIEAQKAEVAIKRDAADNAYKRLLAETGSSDLAEKALRGIQLSKLRAEFEVAAKDGRDKKRQAQAIAMLAETDKTYSLWKANYLQSAEGEVTKSMVNVPGSGGSAGGIRTPRAGEVPNVKTAASQKPKTATSTAEKIAMKKSGVAALDRLDQKHAEMNRSGVWQTMAGDSSLWAGEVDAAAPVIDAGKQGGAPNESTMEALRTGLKSASGDRIKAQIAAERQILLDQITELEGTAGSVPEATPPQ